MGGGGEGGERVFCREEEEGRGEEEEVEGDSETGFAQVWSVTK